MRRYIVRLSGLRVERELVGEARAMGISGARAVEA